MKILNAPDIEGARDLLATIYPGARVVIEMTTPTLGEWAAPREGAWGRIFKSRTGEIDFEVSRAAAEATVCKKA